jgi:hypothetical protein
LRVQQVRPVQWDTKEREERRVTKDHLVGEGREGHRDLRVCRGRKGRKETMDTKDLWDCLVGEESLGSRD